MKEHDRDQRTGSQHTALGSHCTENGHFFDLEKPDILHIDKRYFDRLYKEAWEIKKSKNAVTNKQSANFKLFPTQYLSLM